ncbi:MAG TPA: calcium-binding protein, partial [Pseudomonadales bacterium]|nr:calcium-binding protein [Pseudomonadales bacterium]
LIDGDYTAGNSDTLRLKPGVALADVRLVREGDDLILAVRGADDRITLKQYFEENWRGSRPFAIERIAFADGTVLSFAEVQATLFAGSAEAETITGTGSADHLCGQGGNDTLIAEGGNDLLEGGEGDDLLLGGAGHDTLDGGAGNDLLRGSGTRQRDGWIHDTSADQIGDSYRFGRGDGHDTVIADSWQQSAADRIELKAGVTPADVRLERLRSINDWRVGEDLKLTIRDTGETLTVKNHFDASNRHAVEEILFTDGTVWDGETIRSRTLLGDADNDRLRGFDDRDDLIDGGAGNDMLEGGSGSDSYRFGLNGGQDEIDEGYGTAQDRVVLAPGVMPSDVTVRWTLQGNMAISLSDGSRVSVRGQAGAPLTEGVGIEQLQFAEGTLWSRADLAAHALMGTHGDDEIVAGYQSDTLEGGPGNDRFQNLGGYDSYRFGIGDGQDVIGSGYGRILFKPGIGQNDVAFSRDDRDLIATVTASGDAVRMKAWFDIWQRVDSFEFANGARLTTNDVLDKLNIAVGSEILYGSPGNDLLTGTEKSSTLYGREGNDVLTGNAGRDSLYGEAGDDSLDGGTDGDWLYGGDGSDLLSGGTGQDQLIGEAGNDTLAGGADRDTLHGGAGNNSYVMAPGMGLDSAVAESLAIANDTLLLAAGIRAEQLSVQLGSASWNPQAGDVGYTGLVVGIGGDDALVLYTYGEDLGRRAIQRLRFDDGTEWSLADLIAHADSGRMGSQRRHSGDPATLIGSAADDQLYDATHQSVVVQARGNDDSVSLGAGNDLVSAGSGRDEVHSGSGDDRVAGETGNDTLMAGDGDDVLLFNHGDGQDTLAAGQGLDTLSLGATVTPALLSALLDRDGRVVLRLEGGSGGTITLSATHMDDLGGDLERIQFVDADGKTRVFDLAGWLRAHGSQLLSATEEAPLAFDGSGFELTGMAAPAGGLEAVAYAQRGDLFATAHLAANAPTSGDDLLYGTSAADMLDGGTGNDIVLGLAGDDMIFGGEGSDLIVAGDGDDLLQGGVGDDELHGGWGADSLLGGTGRDRLFGEGGGDSYFYQPGDGELHIDDEHRVINWSYGGT